MGDRNQKSAPGTCPSGKKAAESGWAGQDGPIQNHFAGDGHPPAMLPIASGGNEAEHLWDYVVRSIAHISSVHCRWHETQAAPFDVSSVTGGEGGLRSGESVVRRMELAVEADEMPRDRLDGWRSDVVAPFRAVAAFFLGCQQTVAKGTFGDFAGVLAATVDFLDGSGPREDDSCATARMMIRESLYEAQRHREDEQASR